MKEQEVCEQEHWSFVTVRQYPIICFHLKNDKFVLLINVNTFSETLIKNVFNLRNAFTYQVLTIE